MKTFALLLLLFPLAVKAQMLTQKTFLGRLSQGDAMPKEILSQRSVVLHSYTLTQKEIDVIHENLVRTGIDAVAYFKIDGVLAGRDVARSFSAYFNKREIFSLIIIQKTSSGYVISITAFNGKEDFVNKDQPAWSTQSPSLSEAMNVVYRSALASNKKKNLLINEVPETNLPVSVINGKRFEIFAYDLKIDNMAVPKFADATLDTTLKNIFKGYPFRYQLTDPEIPETELRRKGFLFVLCFIESRSGVARELLDYTVAKSESAFMSVTYPNGEIQLKNISAETPVFKFYARHIDSGNVFLGTKWDADTTWEQALQNFIKGFKAELKIN